jgi:hypothetical protein
LPHRYIMRSLRGLRIGRRRLSVNGPGRLNDNDGVKLPTLEMTMRTGSVPAGAIDSPQPATSASFRTGPCPFEKVIDSMNVRIDGCMILETGPGHSDQVDPGSRRPNPTVVAKRTRWQSVSLSTIVPDAPASEAVDSTPGSQIEPRRPKPTGSRRPNPTAATKRTVMSIGMVTRPHENGESGGCRKRDAEPIFRGSQRDSVAQSTIVPIVPAREAVDPTPGFVPPSHQPQGGTEAFRAARCANRLGPAPNEPNPRSNSSRPRTKPERVQGRGRDDARCRGVFQEALRSFFLGQDRAGGFQSITEWIPARSVNVPRSSVKRTRLFLPSSRRVRSVAQGRERVGRGDGL